MTRVRQRAFSAHVEGLAAARAWAASVLTRAGTLDGPCADAVLVLHELAAQTVGRLKPEHTGEAEIGVYVRAGVGAIGVGTVCETRWLLSPPKGDPLRHYRRPLLEALADEHGTTQDDVLCTCFAELRWHTATRVPVPDHRTAAVHALN